MSDEIKDANYVNTEYQATTTNPGFRAIVPTLAGVYVHFSTLEKHFLEFPRMHRVHPKVFVWFSAKKLKLHCRKKPTTPLVNESTKCVGTYSTRGLFTDAIAFMGRTTMRGAWWYLCLVSCWPFLLLSGGLEGSLVMSCFINKQTTGALCLKDNLWHILNRLPREGLKRL